MTKRTRSKPGDKNYVNNREFTLALDKYARECREAVEDNLEEPVMPRYVAESIMKMAERLALTPRFRGYPFREDMIGNAIIAAVRFAKNFDGDRFNNGFAYITQILFSHMVITIKKEKRKYQTNLEMIQQAQLSAFGNQEMTAEVESHSQMIADQKLADMENGREPKGGGGFKLRTGSSAEARAAYKGGTPLDREED